MRISSSGREYNPIITYSFSTGAWYKLKSVVDGANVKIYINDKLVRKITISGSKADAKSNNYVGLWCHGGTSSKADNFQGNDHSYLGVKVTVLVSEKKDKKLFNIYIYM